MLRVKREYRVWVWDKALEKYLILPCTLDSKGQAVSYLVKQKKDWQSIHVNLDYTNYQIKFREVTYSEWGLVGG